MERLLAMCGVMKGMTTRVKDVAPECKSTHCSIHREQLAVKKMPPDLDIVLKQVVKIVNTIKSRPLSVRLFNIMCDEMGSEYKTLLFHTDVRWLSRGKVLTRVFELRNEIKSFLYDSDDISKELFHDFKWLAKVAYLSDIFSALNNLNLSLQGKKITIFGVQDKIAAFLEKSKLWCKRLDRRQFDNFETLHDFIESSEEEIDYELLNTFKEHIQMLSQNIQRYFTEPDSTKEWIRNPFAVISQVETFNLPARECDMLVDLASDGALKIVFTEKSLPNFWVHTRSEYPHLSDRALKHLLPFPTTYNCEYGFSNLVDIKTKKRNQLDVQPALRLKLSAIEPDLDKLVVNQKQHHHSH